MKEHSRSVWDLVAYTAILASLVCLPRQFQGQELRTTKMQGFVVGPDRLAFLTTFLTLTAAQQEQAKAVLSEEDSAVKPLMDQMKEASDELASVMKTRDGDIDEVAAQIGSISGQLVALDAKAAGRIYQLLTSAQKQRFDQLPNPLLATPSLLGPGPGFAVSGHIETVSGSGPAR